MIDEFTGVACILLIACSLFSFLSMRTTKDNLIVRYEKLADIIFIVALVFVFAITFMIAFSILF
jgi:cytochrome bd-type quinol oxidase subunit 2